ncbi:MAG: class I SAM-dependent methyltransferase [Spirochaetes bacterium]|nr:class I SAM-dependent methyltransferase [Spirochaetota bacterium]
MKSRVNNLSLEKTDCDLCGSGNYKNLYSVPDLRFKNFKHEYSVVQCINCGHRYLSPRPSKDSMHLIYHDNYYKNRNEVDLKQKNRFILQADYLPKIANGKILDIGCAGGGFLKFLKNKGWKCYGVDFIKTKYKEKGINIKYGYLPERSFPKLFFNVITAWGVMEHVHEPSVYFEIINKILDNKGLFIFLIPNGDSLWSRWAFKEDIPRHIHFFRPKIIKEYARQYGFKVHKIYYTNKLYSRPASGKGLFKRRFLRSLDIPWVKIINNSFDLSMLKKIQYYFMKIFDALLIHPKLEELFHLCGNMVVILKKDIK